MCHEFLQKTKGTSGFEPLTYRSAVDCSTTELSTLLNFHEKNNLKKKKKIILLLLLLFIITDFVVRVLSAGGLIYYCLFIRCTNKETNKQLDSRE